MGYIFEDYAYIAKRMKEIKSKEEVKPPVPPEPTPDVEPDTGIYNNDYYCCFW